MFIMTVIGGIIMMLSLIVGILFLVYMLAHIGMILPFRDEYKETEALLKGFVYTDSEYSSEPSSSGPVLSYYNMYREETVEKLFMNSGIRSPQEKNITGSQKMRAAEIGEKIKIQYTKNFARIIDERYVSPNKYKLNRYLTPVIICFSGVIIGAALLIAGILFSQ